MFNSWNKISSYVATHQVIFLYVSKQITNNFFNLIIKYYELILPQNTYETGSSMSDWNCLTQEPKIWRYIVLVMEPFN